MEIKIINQKVISIIQFIDERSYLKFIYSIENCLTDPKGYPFFYHIDENEKVIFSAEYLRNSIISTPIYENKTKI